MLETAVSHPILSNTAILDTAANAWQALKDLYDRETANTTISLLRTVPNRKLGNEASMHDQKKEQNERKSH